MQLPPFMLKKIYQTGSLRNTGDGVCFVLKNAIAPAHLTGIDRLQIDNQAYGETVTLHYGGSDVPAGELSPERPVAFALGQTAEVVVSGARLAPGTHRLVIGLRTKEVGPLTVEVSDTLSGE